MREILSLLIPVVALFFMALPRESSAKGLSDLKLDELHQKAPELELISPDGKHTLLSQLTSGKPLILHFWATWCASCEKELPQLVSLSQKWTQDGIQFVAVSVDQPEKKIEVLKFASKLRAKFPVWMAAHPEQAQSYWAWGLPMTYFINAKGMIVDRAMGAKDWSSVSEPELRKLLQKR